MSDFTFNGTTLTYNAVSVDKITNMKFSEDGNEIDITGISDAKHIFANGLTTEECEITVLGSTALAVGDNSALSITWPDATTEPITNALITSVEKGGSVDGELTSVITIRNSE